MVPVILFITALTFIGAAQAHMPALETHISIQVTQTFAPDASQELDAVTKSAVNSDTPAVEAVQITPTEDQKLADLQFCKDVLLNPTANVNALTPSGITLCQLLTVLYLNSIPTESALNTILLRGGDVNAVGATKKTPLYYIVCYTSCPEIFEKIEAEKVATTAQKETTETSTKKVTTTEKAPAQEDTTKSTHEKSKTEQVQKTALRDRETNLQVVELLLAFGADPLLADESNVSPLQIAVAKRDFDVLNLFAKYGWIEFVQEISDKDDTTTEETSDLQATQLTA